jgi:predicted nucleotidyltransferase
VTNNQEILDIIELIKETVPADQIYLFGSYAFGTPNKSSDYDFYVVLPDGSVKPQDAVQDIYLALSKLKNCTPVDILALDRSEFDEMKILPTLERKIAREGILLFQREAESGSPEIKM